MKLGFAIMFTIFFCFNGFSQFEMPKKTLKIAPISNPSGQVSPTSSRAITYPSIFDKKDKLTESVSLLNKKPEPEKSVMETERFENPAADYTEKMNKKSDGKILEKFKSDSFLGNFKVGIENVFFEFSIPKRMIR